MIELKYIALNPRYVRSISTPIHIGTEKWSFVIEMEGGDAHNTEFSNEQDAKTRRAMYIEQVRQANKP